MTEDAAQSPSFKAGEVSQSQWVSTQDRMPPHENIVLFLRKKDSAVCLGFWNAKAGRWDEHFAIARPKEVSHWLPLPPLPAKPSEEKRPRNGDDHVVMDSVRQTLCCQHCREEAPLKLPCSVSALSAQIEAFTAPHAACVPHQPLRAVSVPLGPSGRFLRRDEAGMWWAWHLLGEPATYKVEPRLLSDMRALMAGEEGVTLKALRGGI